MPPRKRRQSAQGDDTGKEISERICPINTIETDKDVKDASKFVEKNATSVDKSAASHQQPCTEIPLPEKNKESVQLASDSASKQPTRFSTRVVKRPRRDLSPPESPVKKVPGKKQSVPAVVTTPETKGKRQWELWSVEDKDSFFEGLCEYGKDFESIHNLIVAKCRKKGNVMPVTVKNKEQVRHFYYRTWHKISKLIEPVENLKKDIQELYGLISYSVLRKKLRGGVNPNDKNWQKLNELVHHGVATIRIKGKRIRVKTPVCSALKKLNSFEEPSREPGPKVPEKIRVEFRPRTNAAWQQVQTLAQNPRLRITVRPERNLQSVLKYIDKKWRSLRIRAKERLGEEEEDREELRFFPHKDSVLRAVHLSAVEEPVLQYCLTKHNKDSLNTSPTSGKRKKDKDCQAGKGVNGSAVQDSFEALKAVISQVTKCCGCNSACKACACRDDQTGALSKDGTKSGVIESAGKQLCLCKCSGSCDNKVTEVSEDSTDSPVKSGASVLSCVMNNFGSVTENDKTSSIETENKSKCNGCNEQVSCLQSARAFSVPELSAIVDGENAMFPDLLLQNFTDKPLTNSPKLTGIDKDDDKLDSESNITEDPTNKEDDAATRISVLSSQSEMEKVYKDVMLSGWTSNVDETMTLAELYLMFGRDEELRFEYEWVPKKTSVTGLEEIVLLNLNNMLRRLSHLATVEFTDFSKTPGAGTMCQLCGQVQGTKQKGRGREKNGRSKIKAGKDAFTQTQTLPPAKKEIPISPVPIAPKDGVFRVPVVGSSLSHISHPITSLPSKDFLQRPGNTKPLMRPRKLRPVSRCRPVAGEMVQRTLLPKASQLVTFYPVVANSQISSDKNVISQTIVGHPINGIQSQPVTMTTQSTPISTIGVFDTGQYAVSVTCSPSTALGMVEISLSPNGDQTLMTIPADQVGSMSAEVLTAAGLSALPLSTNIHQPITTATTVSHVTSFPTLVTMTTPSTCSSKGSISPPNLSSFLDMSLPSLGPGDSNGRFLDLETDTTFSGLLEDNRPALDQVEPGLTTPPICTTTEQHQSQQLHSPPVRSLFRSSPNTDTAWLHVADQDLSLSEFLESPSKPSSFSQTSSSMFNTSMPLNLFCESSRDSQCNKMDQVDATLQCMMTESSIDYVKKFADLAEQITKNDPGPFSTRKTEANNSPML